MRNINERPVCHRAEDLVTYLYGEANATESRDFADHLERCDACRAEFAIFNQVHDSIALWRNEALGSAFNPGAAVTESTVDSTQFVRHERKLSALAAVREFFSVSPLWLRGATAFAALLLCVLAALVISRSGNKPAELANSSTEPRVYTATDLNNAVAKQIEKIKRTRSQQLTNRTTDGQLKPTMQGELATLRMPSRSRRSPKLTRREREQLAADLRLIPGKDESELPFVFSEEPNQ